MIILILCIVLIFEFLCLHIATRKKKSKSKPQKYSMRQYNKLTGNIKKMVIGLHHQWPTLTMSERIYERRSVVDYLFEELHLLSQHEQSEPESECAIYFLTSALALFHGEQYLHEEESIAYICNELVKNIETYCPIKLKRQLTEIGKKPLRTKIYITASAG